MAEILDANGKTLGPKKEITDQKKLAWLFQQRQFAQTLHEAAICDAIAKMINEPREKVTGCSWRTDKVGGFEVKFYIAKAHLANLTMPADDADTVTRLLAKPDGASILSACAVIMGYWARQARDDQKRISDQIGSTKQ